MSSEESAASVPTPDVDAQTPSTPQADADVTATTPVATYDSANEEVATPKTDVSEASPASADAGKELEPDDSTTAASLFAAIKDVGASVDKNARYRRTMEDEHISVDRYGDVDHQAWFGVYDGHGGRAAVDYVKKNLHENFLRRLASEETVEEAMRLAYIDTDNGIREAQITFSGSTVITAFVRKEEEGKALYSGNAGDARTVLSRNGKAVRLTYDHKGNDASEQKRIAAAGGFVIMNRVNGILAVTRSLGDITMKEYVTGEPYQTKIILQETDRHLILACDGLWDVCDDQEAVDLISNIASAQEAADLLKSHALQAGTTDNISVMVVHL